MMQREPGTPLSVGDIFGGDPAVFSVFWPVLPHELSNHSFLGKTLYSYPIGIVGNQEGAPPVQMCMAPGKTFVRTYSQRSRQPVFQEDQDLAARLN